MLEQDYLMRMILMLVNAMRRSMEKSEGEDESAESLALLENAFGEAVGLDANTVLSLSPESMASVVQVSGVDPRLIEHLSFSLLLMAERYDSMGNETFASLRRAQAESLSSVYGYRCVEDVSEEAFEELVKMP